MLWNSFKHSPPRHIGRDVAVGYCPTYSLRVGLVCQREHYTIGHIGGKL